MHQEHTFPADQEASLPQIEAVPSSQVVAHVRFAEPADAPPGALVPWVAWHETEDGGDWSLTEDAVAFGDPGVTAQFVAWRLQWEEYWVLEPASSIDRLRDLVVEFKEAGALTDSCLDEYLVDETVIPVAAQQRIVDDVAALRGELARSEVTGYGFVDATPGPTRPGLARTWSPTGGPEVLVASTRVVGTMDPDEGLVVTGIDPDGAHVLAGVDHFELQSGSVVLRSGDDTMEMTIADATPLAWLVPAASVWRVRTIPLSLVWARTLAGLDASCRRASELRRSVRLSARRHVDRLSTHDAIT